jgi:hypothetical protein
MVATTNQHGENMATVIEVCERLADHHHMMMIDDAKSKTYKIVKAPKYHAQIKGSGPWGCGTSRAEAVGDLVIHNPASIVGKVTVKYLGKLAR